MEIIETQLLALLPFIGLGLLLTLAYVADGQRMGRAAPPDDGAVPVAVPDPAPSMDDFQAYAMPVEPSPAVSSDWTEDYGESQGEPILKWMVLALLGMADLAAIVLGSLTAVSGALLRSAPEIIGDGGVPPAFSDESMPIFEFEAIAEALTDILLPLGATTATIGFVGFILLIPASRQLLARLIPIDPRRIAHTVALHYALLLVLFSVVVALTIPIIAADPGGRDAILQATEGAGLLGIWVQNLGFSLLGLLGVGLFVARGPREALLRLGITPRIDVRWWLGATIAALAASWGVDALWSAVSPDSLSEVEGLSELLFEPIIAYGIAGALTIGLAAGIGEEIIFRGAMQPRLGLVLTALLFTAIHTQYTVSLALVQILVVALLLGYARKHANTTTAIAIHSTYNFALAMTAVLSM